ncbi:hypothetical protein Q5P01_008256 [Channa striata]|uniref:Uncharacterized protein n=1 Tax=Channa striata TaxID=64152 RepID=A0AA88SVK8_CHASR|nr:hypothetical protein Q5P01_008256 [Channa striata]
MNCTALLILLALMGTAWSSPVPNLGHHGKCYKATNNSYLTNNFKHVSDLHNSSVAIWNISRKAIENTYPEVTVHYANCIRCTEPGLIIKPIIFQVSIYKRENDNLWRCPYDLEVDVPVSRNNDQ